MAKSKLKLAEDLRFCDQSRAGMKLHARLYGYSETYQSFGRTLNLQYRLLHPKRLAQSPFVVGPQRVLCPLGNLFARSGAFLPSSRGCCRRQGGTNPNTKQQQKWRTVGHKVHTHSSRSHRVGRMPGVLSKEEPRCQSGYDESAIRGMCGKVR